MAETVKGPILHLCAKFQTTQQANVVGPTSTIASTVNLLLPTTVVSLLHWSSNYVERGMIDVPWRNSL